MLTSLKIKNIALIDEAIINFGPGLNILSGETGAGKSLVVGSMNLILGDRADREMVKTGTDHALVQAVFNIDPSRTKQFFEENDIESDDDTVIISRRLSADGKNSCKINGCSVTTSLLRSFMENHVDLHGQHEHQTLLYPKNHIKFIDSFAGESVIEIKDEICEKIRNLKQINSELEQVGGSKEDVLKQIDYLEYQVSEIEKAEIRPGEEAQLKQECEILENAEKINEILNSGYTALYGASGSVVEVLSSVISGLQQISEKSEKYSNLQNQISESYYSLEDAAHELKSESDKVYFDQNRYSDINQRLDVIKELERKYGGTEEAVLDYFHEISLKLEKLNKSDELIEEYEKKKSILRHELYCLHMSLFEKRRNASSGFEKIIIDELNDLGMSGSEFIVRFSDIPEENDCDLLKNEIIGAEFYISTNAGEPVKSLSKVASGGEISRIMLAFKNVFSCADETETLIFDEIDTGISGRMANVVAEKMSRISSEKQIICVTHLPQIVAFGDINFLISKSMSEGKTNTSISCLDNQGKISEVARLVGGDSESAKNHAAELIREADDKKEVFR